MIRVFNYSEPGGHAENQDAYEVRAHPLDANSYVCVIADGQGGRSGAAAAARLACKVTVDVAETNTPADLFRPATWITLLSVADCAVRDDTSCGMTTLIAFFLSGDRVCGASSGDTAVYLVAGAGPGTILTDRQHKNPPVGSGGAAFVGFAAPLVCPWKVLAMTDGVWKYVGWERLAAIADASNGQALVDSLLDSARLPRTGRLQDDFTVVLVEESGA